jgi:hypothetical protein
LEFPALENIHRIPSRIIGQDWNLELDAEDPRQEDPPSRKRSGIFDI